MNKVHLFLATFLLFIAATAQGQQAKGLVFDDAEYEATPMKAPLTRGLYTSVSDRASLKAYCPIPGNQNPYGTCVGWSTSYAARTILWAKARNETNKTTITANAYSPDFVYRSVVPYAYDPDCSQGTKIPTALQFMQTRGVVLRQDFQNSCPPSVPAYLSSQAAAHRIDQFASIFGLFDGASTKIAATKKSLSEGHPVVIGMNVPPSFDALRSELWSPTESLSASQGGHAMCVMGYDDTRFGGAFEVMNSWGTNWGNQGFFWVKYSDYAYWTKYGFELINNIKPEPIVVVPTPTPTPKPNPTPAPPAPAAKEFAGDLRIAFLDGGTMKATIQEVRGLKPVEDQPTPQPQPKPQPNPQPRPNKPNNFAPDPNITTGKFIAYRADRAYTQGTKFRVYLRNNEPAYVYMIAMDGTNQVVTLFPHKPNISPALNYKNSEIALPTETTHIEMDNVRGTDILCLLYSKEQLDMNQINQRLTQESGTFFQRLYKVLGKKMVDRQYLRYYNERMRFEVKSYGEGTIVPLVLEIPHN